MSTLLDELSKKARTLVVEERAQLAQELLESIEREVDPGVQAAWEGEIADRIAKYERGEAKLVSAEEVFAAARLLTNSAGLPVLGGLPHRTDRTGGLCGCALQA